MTVEDVGKSQAYFSDIKIQTSGYSSYSEEIGPAFENEKLLVLNSRIMQKHSISEVCSDYGFTGKKSLEQYLQAQVRDLLAI